ncbi:MAG TPA: AAA family ATPase [Bacilli bacterium]|nr:AAA family ATPase [Bacilli bacterium]
MKLKRKVYDNLLSWKKDNGKTALLIEGARRVGKSTVVEEFAKNEYKSYVLIDFSIANDEIKSLFKKYASNLNDLFFFLTSITGVTLYERQSLIIFDEVQLFPPARQLIKHLVKDNRYDYIETGSLLSIKRNVENILIPSEERAIKMHPLDFEEFCSALGREDIITIIRSHFDNLKPLGEIHSTIMKLFRQYILIGGMPQAVVEYLKTNDYTKVDRIKKDILKLYRNDIAKYAKGYEHKVLSIFDEIPSQLTKHEKKFMLSSLSKDARFRDYEDAFTWLDEAMITNTCFNASDPNLGLSLNSDRLTLKIYMADTGLLLSHAFSENDEMHRDVAKAIVQDRLEINNGMIFENIVAQMLTALNKKLYFYSRADNQDRSNTMEIDFLIIDKTKPTKISPVEVKSGKNYTTSSLNKFSLKFHAKLGKKYLIHTKDLFQKDGITYIPVYMTMFL